MRPICLLVSICWAASAQIPASARIPDDPHELVTAKTVVKPMDRSEGLALLNKAKRPMRLLAPATPHYSMKVRYTAFGDPANSGTGELNTLWLGAQNGRWSATFGNFTMTRLNTRLGTYDEKPVALVPMRVHMLRNTIFWAAQGVTASSQFRAATAEWNGRPVTCLLISDQKESDAKQPRRWDESEYCIDDQTALLQILSVAPGSYVVYSYSGQSFHGQPMPDRIKTYIAGTLAIDASFRIDEPDVPGGTVITATPEMMASEKPIGLDEPLFRRLDVPNASVSSAALPVIVNAQIGPDGKVMNAEICAASDRALVAEALPRVKATAFGNSNVQRQAYIQVRFIPIGSAPTVTTTPKGYAPIIAAEPYYLEQLISIPGRRVDAKEILARRSDGATLRMSTAVPASQSPLIRELRFPDAKRVTVYDSARAKVTWPVSPADKMVAAIAIPPDCYAGASKVLRRDQMEGQDVIVIENIAGSFRMTRWAAPKLACENLYVNVEVMQTDGSFKPSAETKTVKLVIGEPDPRLFEIGPDLAEMKPSEALGRIWDSLDLGLDTEQKTALLREIKRVGEEMDKRYETKGQ